MSKNTSKKMYCWSFFLLFNYKGFH